MAPPYELIDSIIRTSVLVLTSSEIDNESLLLVARYSGETEANQPLHKFSANSNCSRSANLSREAIISLGNASPERREKGALVCTVLSIKRLSQFAEKLKNTSQQEITSIEVEIMIISAVFTFKSFQHFLHMEKTV